MSPEKIYGPEADMAAFKKADDELRHPSDPPTPVELKAATDESFERQRALIAAEAEKPFIAAREAKARDDAWDAEQIAILKQKRAARTARYLRMAEEVIARSEITGLADDQEDEDLSAIITGPGKWRLDLLSAGGQPNGGRLGAYVSGYVLGAIKSA